MTFSSHSARNHVFVWDKKFCVRRANAYAQEDKRLEVGDRQTMTGAFLEARMPIIHPTYHYSYTALQRFLEKAQMSDFVTASNTPASQGHGQVLVDDRRDASGGPHSTRDWDSYSRWPPEGDNIWTKVLDARELYLRLSQKIEQRQDNGAERRTIYIADLTPLCALAIAATASRLHGPQLRDYLQRYVSYRVYFGISVPFGFAMEFHLPYYALRKHASVPSDRRNLRRSGRFICDWQRAREPEYFHEAQISLLVIGIDEWYWTAYCCADVYFGSEESPEFYLREQLDASTGAGNETSLPVWNPREYFLTVISRRMKQATKEWSNIVTTLEERLGSHEDSIFNEKTLAGTFVDDNDFTRTREYTWTGQVLRLFHNSLTKTIQSWDNFESNEIQYFHPIGSGPVQTSWALCFASMKKDMTELKFLQLCLQQRIETFDTMRNSLVNASTLVESRAATEQGKNIGLLTRVTVTYLPLSLVTGVFSMAMIPNTVSWWIYLVVLISVTIITLYVAFNLGLLISLWQRGQLRYLRF